MATKTYSLTEKNLLLQNKNISKVTGKSVMYTTSFKIYALHQYIENNKSPTQIFLDAGINLDIIGPNKPSECINRWKKNITIRY